MIAELKTTATKSGMVFGFGLVLAALFPLSIAVLGSGAMAQAVLKEEKKK